MDVPDSQTNLHKPAQYLALGKVHFGFLCSFNSLGEIPSSSVLHNNVQFHLCSAIYLPKMDDVRVMKHLKYFGLFQGRLLFIRTHIDKVDLFDDTLISCLFLLDQIGSPIGATSQQFDSFVYIGLTLVLFILGVLHSIYIIVMPIFHFYVKFPIPQHSLPHQYPSSYLDDNLAFLGTAIA